MAKAITDLLIEHTETQEQQYPLKPNFYNAVFSVTNQKINSAKEIIDHSIAW